MVNLIKVKIHEILGAIFPNYKIGSRILESHKFLLEGVVLAKLDIPDGLFYIDTQSKMVLSAFSGTYENQIEKYLKKVTLKKDDTIVNIGANIGFYTVSLSNLFKNNSVIGIEPNPEAYTLLEKNIFINGLKDRVTLFNSCVSSEMSEVTYNYIKGKSEFSSLKKIIPEYAGDAVQITKVIKSYPLQHFTGKTKIGLIVMDVEGAENLVLDGAIDLIKKDLPVIIMECADKLLVSFNSSAYKVISILESLGYTILALDNPSLKITRSYNGTILAYNRNDSHFKL